MGMKRWGFYSMKSVLLPDTWIIYVYDDKMKTLSKMLAKEDSWGIPRFHCWDFVSFDPGLAAGQVLGALEAKTVLGIYDSGMYRQPKKHKEKLLCTSTTATR